MAEHPFAPATEEEALAAIRHVQWPSGEPTCPRCGSTSTRLDRARYRHGRCVRYCRDCRRTFTDLTATPMFNSQTPLTLWIAAILYYPRLPAGRLAAALGLSHCRAAHIRQPHPERARAPAGACLPFRGSHPEPIPSSHGPHQKPIPRNSARISSRFSHDSPVAENSQSQTSCEAASMSAPSLRPLRPSPPVPGRPRRTSGSAVAQWSGPSARLIRQPRCAHQKKLHRFTALPDPAVRAFPVAGLPVAYVLPCHGPHLPLPQHLPTVLGTAATGLSWPGQAEGNLVTPERRTCRRSRRGNHPRPPEQRPEPFSPLCR